MDRGSGTWHAHGSSTLRPVTPGRDGGEARAAQRSSEETAIRLTINNRRISYLQMIAGEFGLTA